MIIDPSDLDGIQLRAVEAIKAFFRHGASVNISTNRHETMFQLGLLCRGQGKLYAHGGKAARIVPEPRFHHLFVRRKA